MKVPAGCFRYTMRQKSAGDHALNSTKTRPVVGLVTLGCDKNTVDMEHVAGLLARGGCDALPLGLEVPEDGAPAPDAVVILTCGFVADAKVQSVETVVEWADPRGRAQAQALNGIPALF